MATWLDDDGQKVEAVSAEQHALDHPGHEVKVLAMPVEPGASHQMLKLRCGMMCGWWDEQGVRVASDS